MFRKPLRITARKDVFWYAVGSDLPVRGSGATPREAMDDLAGHLVEAVGKIRIRETDDDPMRALFSEYIDLDRLCPDPDVGVCSDRAERFARSCLLDGFGYGSLSSLSSIGCQSYPGRWGCSTPLRVRYH